MENFDTGRTEDGQTVLYSTEKACYNVDTFVISDNVYKEKRTAGVLKAVLFVEA